MFENKYLCQYLANQDILCYQNNNNSQIPKSANFNKEQTKKYCKIYDISYCGCHV